MKFKVGDRVRSKLSKEEYIVEDLSNLIYVKGGYSFIDSEIELIEEECERCHYCKSKIIPEYRQENDGVVECGMCNTEAFKEECEPIKLSTKNAEEAIKFLEKFRDKELKTGDKAMFWDYEDDEKIEGKFLFKNDMGYGFTKDSNDTEAGTVWSNGQYFIYHYCEPIKEVSKEEALEACDRFESTYWEIVNDDFKKIKQYILNN